MKASVRRVPMTMGREPPREHPSVPDHGGNHAGFDPDPLDEHQQRKVSRFLRVFQRAARDVSSLPLQGEHHF